ncbi:MAG TPA: CinA family nicotinamide mononucleotide deamidase-related protein, partial [Pirellulaceae bacterium]|nr:CinA family nicotinamide mononucleotide deamidase-related protein [Pirellulaceae bacterium]
GDELTSGQRLDTNSQWLAERLLELGVPVAFHTTVGDVLEDNVEVFRRAIARAEIVVASGGLGPTADDLTRHAIAEVAGVELVRDDAALAHIKALFARRKREMPPANEIQAMFPRGSRVIPNPHGSAPGIDIDVGRDSVARHAAAERRPTRIVALPGVPAEMKEMWESSVAPAIREHLGITKTICHYRIKCFGVGESDLEAMLPDLIARQRYPLVGITVSQATITLRITAEGDTREAALAAMQPTIDTIHACLGDLVFGYEDDELQDVVVRLLRERKKTLMVTEWATGGMLSEWLAEAGAEDVFHGGLVMMGQSEWHHPNNRGSHDADYELIVGTRPQADSPTTAPGNLIVMLVHGNQIIRKEFPFAGHPEILRPRAAKQALNLLRLNLVGK